jgi:hypothetical protein
MRGKWGTIWLAALLVIGSLICPPGAARAADIGGKPGLFLVQLSAQSPLEAQMLGEKPSPAPVKSGAAFWSEALSGFQPDQDGTTALKLPFNLEMQISVHYRREPVTLGPQKDSDSLLTNSSLSYRLLPNLKVGLNAYLYRPDPGDKLSLRPFGDQVMGLGPGLKYDLGRWSFLLKSQVETGNPHGGTDLQNWFRVWYAY